MVKLFSVYFPKKTLELIVVESFLVLGALLLPAVILFGADASDALVAESRGLKIALAAGVCVASLYGANLYSPRYLRNEKSVYPGFVQGLGIAAVVLALLYSVFPTMQVFRGFAITGISLAAILLVSNRKAFIAHERAKKAKGPLVILGDGHLAGSIAVSIAERSDLGLQLAGYFGDLNGNDGAQAPRWLGRIEDFARIAEKIKPGRVIVAMGERRRKLPIDELLTLKTSGVTIQDAAEFYEIVTGKLPVESIRPSSLIFSPGFKVSRMALVYRRILSFVLAGIGLSLLGPLIGLIALAIRLDSPGPAIFRQKRVGYHGKRFTLYKFRTMHVDADHGGYARPAEHNDPRVTRVGRVLRRLRLDEIPQLYNILIGDMHFIGPRPFVPEQEMDCARHIPLYSYRWSVRPGATGWAQVQRGYCASLRDNTDKLAYDLFYIKNMSLGLDLLILVKTVEILFTAKGGR